MSNTITPQTTTQPQQQKPDKEKLDEAREWLNNIGKDDTDEQKILARKKIKRIFDRCRKRKKENARTGQCAYTITDNWVEMGIVSADSEGEQSVLDPSIVVLRDGTFQFQERKLEKEENGGRENLVSRSCAKDTFREDLYEKIMGRGKGNILSRAWKKIKGNIQDLYDAYMSKKQYATCQIRKQPNSSQAANAIGKIPIIGDIVNAFRKQKLLNEAIDKIRSTNKDSVQKIAKDFYPYNGSPFEHYHPIVHGDFDNEKLIRYELQQPGGDTVLISMANQIKPSINKPSTNNLQHEVNTISIQQ